MQVTSPTIAIEKQTMAGTLAVRPRRMSHEVFARALVAFHTKYSPRAIRPTSPSAAKSFRISQNRSRTVISFMAQSRASIVHRDHQFGRSRRWYNPRMGTFQIDPPPISSYPEKWAEDIFECDCGTKCRIHFEDLGSTFASQQFQHSCGRGQIKWIPGRIFASWELRSDAWLFIPQSR